MSADGTGGSEVLAVGTVLGRYHVLGLVVQGAMGEVYACRDDALRRTVAIKRLRSGIEATEERRDRLRREAMLHGQLVHENVVRVHDIFVHDGVEHIVSEYVDGETLGDLIARDALPLHRIAEIGVSLCRGLAAAHARRRGRSTCPFARPPRAWPEDLPWRVMVAGRNGFAAWTPRLLRQAPDPRVKPGDDGAKGRAARGHDPP